MKTIAGTAIGGMIGTAAGLLGGAAYLAVAATVRGESFDGMGLLFFGLLGAPVGLVLGAAVGGIVGFRRSK